MKKLPKIIACSGYDSKEIKNQCHKHGMDHYLVKPIDQDEM